MLTAWGGIVNLHKLPMRGNRTNTENKRKQATFPFFFPSNSSFPSLLSPGISHLASALLDMSLIFVSKSLLTIKMCWNAGNVDIHRADAAPFPLFSQPWVPDSSRLWMSTPAHTASFKTTLGLWRALKVLLTSTRLGKTILGLGSWLSLRQGWTHALYLMSPSSPPGRGTLILKSRVPCMTESFDRSRKYGVFPLNLFM